MSSECYQPDITQALDAFQNMQLMEQEHRPKSKDGERLKTMYEEIVDAQISVLGTPTVRDASKLQVTIIDLDVQRSKVMAWALGVGVELKFQHRTNGLVSSLIDRTLGELAKSKCFRVDELSGLVDDRDLKLMAMACLSIGRKFLEIDESWREEVPGIPREILGVYYKQLLDEPEDVRRLAPEYTVANLLEMEQKVCVFASVHVLACVGCIYGCITGPLEFGMEGVRRDPSRYCFMRHITSAHQYPSKGDRSNRATDRTWLDNWHR